MKDRDLREVQDRLDALTERVSEIGEAQDRNDDAVHQLAGALSELVGRLRKQDRTISLNSFVAYALFTVLLGAAFFMLYRGRADGLVRDRDHAVVALAAAEERAGQATAELAARKEAEKAAAEMVELLRDHRYKEAIAAEAGLEGKRLTPAEEQLIADAVLRAREELAGEGLARAREALGRGQEERAMKEAKAALEIAPRSAHTAQLHYVIGASLNKLGRAADSALELEKALSGGVDREIDDARYLYATVLDKLGRREDARAAYRAFAAGSPRHPKASWARQRSWQLAGPAPPEKKPAATRPAAPATKPAAPADGPAAPGGASAGGGGTEAATPE
ncbi:MAG TPA: hypothetical protein VKZ63_04895 [Kofleriaceae bacterium]|nr:hypothetical protein [Kofleriaceae bacterium]